MPTMYDAAGNPIEVADEDVAAYYDSGKYGFLDGQQVAIVGPNGEQGTVDAADFGSALESGYRNEFAPETQAREDAVRYGTAGQAFRAGAEGAARGLTFGVSDVVAQGLSPGTAEEMAKRRAANPFAAGAGEVTGALAPALFTGGASAGVSGLRGALGAAGRAVTAPGRAVAGLAQGGGRLAGGLTRGLEGSALGRVGGRVLRTGVEGAIEGGVAGAGLALSEAALAGGNYDDLGEKMLAGLQQGAAFGALTGGVLGGAIGAGGEAVRRIPIAKAGDELLEGAALKALNPSKSQMRSIAGREAMMNQRLLDDGIVRALDDTDDMLQKASDKVTEYGEKIGEVVRRVDGADATSLFSKLQKEIDVRRGAVSGGVQKTARAIEDEIVGLPGVVDEATDTIPLDVLHRARRDVDKQAYAASQARELSKADTLQKVRGIYEDAIEDTIKKSEDKTLLAQYRDAKNGYESAIWAQKQLLSTTAGEKSNRMFGLTDTMAGLAGASSGLVDGGITAAAVQGMGGAAANKFIREKGWGILADIGNKVKKQDKRVKRALSDFFSTAGKARTMAIGEATRRELRERKSVDKLLERKKKDKSAAEAYRRFIKRSKEVVNNPLGVTEKFGERAFQAAPSTMAAATQAVVRGNQYLLDNAPAGLLEGKSMQPAQNRMDPSPIELAEFADRVQIVKDPASVLDELNAGTLNVTQVETLRATRPALFADYQRQIADQLIAMDEPLAYDKRILLGTLFDLPTDPSLEYQAIAAAQAQYQVAPPAKTPPKPTKGGTDKMVDLHRSEVDEMQQGEIV